MYVVYIVFAELMYVGVCTEQHISVLPCKGMSA